jgi:uncharacterized membrane protein
VSIIVLILYINHIGQSLRAAALIESVGDETRELLNKMYLDDGHDAIPHDPSIVCASRSGVVYRIGYHELVSLAERSDCQLTLIPMLGDFVPAGAPLFRVRGNVDQLDHHAVQEGIALGPERTLNQDVAYGFRMLVDIAERSLSDAFDPTTAVQAIDRLHDCLRQLARRPFPSSEYRDAHGVLRLEASHITWDGYVRLAFDEIRETGADSSQVVRRLRAALDDLLTVALPDRRAPLQQQLDLLDAAVDANDWSDAERSLVMSDMRDPQGIGSASDLTSVATQR